MIETVRGAAPDLITPANRAVSAASAVDVLDEVTDECSSALWCGTFVAGVILPIVAPAPK
jgi:hypothetical protein